MKTMPVISIIIPVYNVEDYLGPCIQSVLNQTFSDFELILVDDGSTDSSVILCDAYAAKDSRIRVLHRVHAGPSVARNAGIDAALGEYIGFVDADDWIEPDMYALLQENCVSYDAEISACGFIKIYDYNTIGFHTDVGPTRCYTPEEALRHMFQLNHMRYSACNKLFHRSLFDTVRYPEGQLLEDKGTTYKLIHLSDRVVWCDAPKYHYFMRPGSIMHDVFTKHHIDLFAVNEELLIFIDANYPELKGLAAASYSSECLKLLLHMKKCRFYDADPFNKCVASIRHNIIHIIKAQNTKFGTKALSLLVSIFPGFFKYKGHKNANK